MYAQLLFSNRVIHLKALGKIKMVKLNFSLKNSEIVNARSNILFSHRVTNFKALGKFTMLVKILSYFR